MLALATVFLTGFYVFRSLILAFHGSERYEPPETDVSRFRRAHRREQARRAHVAEQRHLHALSQVMLVPMVLLGGLSLLASIITPGFGDYLAPVFTRYGDFGPEHHDINAMYVTIAVVSTLLAAAGIGLAYLFYVRRPGLPAQWTARYRAVYGLLLNRYYVDQLYDRVFVRTARGAGNFIGRQFDPNVVDGVVTGISRLTGQTAVGLRTLQTGYLRNYALAILAGAVLVLLYIVSVGVAR